MTIDPEQALLGGCLFAGLSAFRKLKCKPQDFWPEKHRVLHRAMIALAEKDCEIDVATVAHQLQLKGDVDRAGGIAYLAELSRSVPTAANIEHYDKIVRTTARRRRAKSQAKELAISLDSGDDLQTALEAATSTLGHLASDLDVRAGCSIKDALLDWDDERQRLMTQGDGLLGEETGLVDLDIIWGGITRGDLHLLGGRPGIGKTALTHQIGAHVARNGGRVVVVSLEMNRRQVANRLLTLQAAHRARHLKLDSRKVQQGAYEANSQESRAIMQGFEDLARMAIHIEDNGGHTPVSMYHSIQQIMSKWGGIDLVIVDYIQLLKTPRSIGVDRIQQVSWLSRELRKMASSLDIPILCVAQLSRALESRADKHPMMSDLRASGQLEQDAASVILLYRQDYYTPERQDATQGVAEVIVSKNRHGGTGTALVGFEGPTCSFWPITQAHQQQYWQALRQSQKRRK